MKDKYCEGRRFRSFAAWLRVNLVRNKMIQKDIAAVMGVTSSWVSHCASDYTPVRLATVEKFCYGFGHPEDAYNVWKILC